MNSLVLNNSGLNSSAVVVAVGLLATGLLSLTADASANIRAYGGSTGNVATTVSAYGYQRHNAVPQLGTSVVSGTASAIRQGGYIPKTDFLNTTGSSANRTIRSYGGSSNSINTSGIIAPNYFIEPSTAQPGELTSTITVEPIKLIPGKAVTGFMRLSGLFVAPRVVTVEDLYVITSLDGFAIPANALGKGTPGGLGLTGSCSGVRTVAAAANVQLWGDGPQAITNDAAVLNHQGYLPTTGLTNVAIRKAGTTHYEHYYEDWLILNAGIGTATSVVYKNVEANTVSLAVRFEANCVRRATAIPDSSYSFITGNPLTDEKYSGLVAHPGNVRLTGPSLGAVTEKPQEIESLLGTTGTATAVIRRTGEALVELRVTGSTLQQNMITPASIYVGLTELSGSTTAVRRVESYANTTQLALLGEATAKVFKHSYSVGNVSTTGTVVPLIMFTTNDIFLETTGFGFARYVHVSKPAEGVTQLLDSGNDYRLAVRGDNSGSTSLIDSGNDYRVAVRGDNSGSVVLSGNIFEVVNLFSRADETRQIEVPPSPFKGSYYVKTADLNDSQELYETTPRHTLHYIEVTQ